MKRLTCYLVSALAVMIAAGAAPAYAADVARATGPTQVEPGNLMVFQGTANGPLQETWLILPHEGGDHLLFVVTVAADGTVSVTSRPLLGGDDPDDPDDPPPPKTLVQLVDEWATAAGDPQNRLKLAAAYQGTLMLVEQGSVTTSEQLVKLQALANTTLLGSAANKWQPFFTKLGEHLDANTPADLAGYKVVWGQIVEGLRQ